jgi:hypothetical protein
MYVKRQKNSGSDQFLSWRAQQPNPSGRSGLPGTQQADASAEPAVPGLAAASGQCGLSGLGGLGGPDPSLSPQLAAPSLPLCVSASRREISLRRFWKNAPYLFAPFALFAVKSLQQ